jgi:hypothetical protein
MVLAIDDFGNPSEQRSSSFACATRGGYCRPFSCAPARDGMSGGAELCWVRRDRGSSMISAASEGRLHSTVFVRLIGLGQG